MNNDEVRKKLKQLQIEEFVWLIYIGIIAMSLYANKLESDFFIHNNLKSKEKYREMIIIIFSILVIVYLYFLKDAYDSLKNMNPNESEKKKQLLFLSFLGSLLISISGFIFLYVALKDENIDVEIAFN